MSLSAISKHINIDAKFAKHLVVVRQVFRRFKNKPHKLKTNLFTKNSLVIVFDKKKNGVLFLFTNSSSGNSV